MIDDRISTLARRTTSTQLADLDQPLAMAIAGWRRQLHGNGRLHLYVMQAYEQEIVRRADVVWRNLHRAHGSFGSQITPALGADLFQAFRQDLDAALDALRPRFDADMKDAPRITKGPDWAQKLAAARDHEVGRYDAEIQHYVASLEAAAARGTPAGASYVFHGTVGAVLTGAGSVANVVQNINPGHREALLKAIELVKQAITAAPELQERDRQELVEVANDAVGEAKKEAPNTRRLGFALQTLASTVQGIASGPGAYEVLRSAAAAIGIAV